MPSASVMPNPSAALAGSISHPTPRNNRTPPGIVATTRSPFAFMGTSYMLTACASTM